MPEVFKTPDYVPTKWLVGSFLVAMSCLGSAFYLGYSMKSLDSRVLAVEMTTQGIVSDRATQMIIWRDQTNNILQRLTRIESQNDMILKRLR